MRDPTRERTRLVACRVKGVRGRPPEPEPMGPMGEAVREKGLLQTQT